ncbi:MAG TPA: metalloregulator ArsR/SmtB family transcription factor [Polyangiaceae bacterium]|jgi:ArsR family transcriptional regulator|nr:metalloregulator ArsR/SmtB family transcription factor [Polyangiaceae bacterium]
MKRAPRKPRASVHAHPRRPKPEALGDVAFTRAAALFRAAGDVARLRLLHALGQTEWCVSELAAESGTKLSTLSQQLRLLYSERIVERRRDGKHIYYRLVDEHVRDLVRVALEHAAEEA